MFTSTSQSGLVPVIPKSSLQFARELIPEYFPNVSEEPEDGEQVKPAEKSNEEPQAQSDESKDKGAVEEGKVSS